MRRYALMPLLVAIAVPTAGSAQALRQNVTPTSRDVQRGGDWYQANMRSHSNKNISSDGSSRECLIQRKTGRTVCLHRREWQEVASGKRDWNGKRVQN